MSRSRYFSAVISLVSIATILVTLSACGSGGSVTNNKPLPPTISKTFGAGTIPLNGTTSLTFTLSNPNTAIALTGVGFTDALPSGLVVSTPNGLAGTCSSGILSFPAGGSSVSLSGGTLATAASCTISINVTGTSEGAQNNTTIGVTSMEGGTGAVASATVTVGGSTGKIQHVVVIFQENRSPDNLFQDPVLIGRGADIQNYGIDSNGNTIPLKQTSLVTDYDLGHGHPSFLDMCDLNSVSGQCQMDGADKVPHSCAPGSTDCPVPDMAFGYVNPAEVAPYFQLAEEYTFADHMFQTNQGPSFPAHQFIISGTSAPSAGSPLFASENPNGPKGSPSVAGCDAAVGSTVALIDPTGSEKTNAPIYPCFEHQTLTDLLETNGNTWRYYTPGTAPYTSPAIWTGPEAISHICGPQAGALGPQCVGTDWLNHVVINQTQVLTDIANNQLQDVTWVIPSGQASDHAETTDGSGPSWVASVVNAIGNSPYWADTAILITWDDWGGWYDHVAPPQVLINCAQWGCGYVYGFRVPLIVVSPYAKAAYISHQQHDFGSILKFIESTFNLPSLGYADVAADNLSDCFDFTQTPIGFEKIRAPLDARHFLEDKSVAKDPDDD